MITEVGGGHYKEDLTTTHMNTPGLMSQRATATGADACDLPNFCNVIAVDKQDAVRMGMTSLPNVASGSAGAIPTTGTGANQIAVDGAGNVKADVNKWLTGTIPAVNVTGVPKVDVVDWLGTAPAAPTVAGIPKVEDATLQARLTSARAGYLDNLNVGGNVASSTEVTSIQNNTRCVRVVPDTLDIPDTGTRTYRIELMLYDSVGKWLINAYGMGGDLEAFRAAYKHWGPWIVLVQGLTPIPYKLLTIAAGFSAMNLPFFMLLSAFTRGLRFFGEATLLYFFGVKVKEILDKYLEVALIVFLALVVGGVFLARYVFGATLS